MKIISWNVAGIRSSFKKSALDWLQGDNSYDIVCFQETKCTETEANKIMPSWIKETYPYCFWNSCTGEYQHLGFQRKGFSGTSIWSKQPCHQLASPEFDKEGRTTTVEFSEFIIVTVYTPNSQAPNSNRFRYRVQQWDLDFLKYIDSLNHVKPTIICGDFNVAHQDKDVYNPVAFKNKVAGFMDDERTNFTNLLNLSLEKDGHNYGYKDAFRMLYPDLENQYTFWTQIQPQLRRTNRGWRIDYFLLPSQIQPYLIDCQHLTHIMGSDHCPILLEINPSLYQKKMTIVKKQPKKVKLIKVEQFS
jgi:exodeoxyribonuclease-3